MLGQRALPRHHAFRWPTAHGTGRPRSDRLLDLMVSAFQTADAGLTAGVHFKKFPEVLAGPMSGTMVSSFCLRFVILVEVPRTLCRASG